MTRLHLLLATSNTNLQLHSPLAPPRYLHINRSELSVEVGSEFLSLPSSSRVSSLCSVILVVDDRSYNELDMMVAPGNIVKLHIPASDDYKPLLTDDPRPAQPSQSEK